MSNAAQALKDLCRDAMLTRDALTKFERMGFNASAEGAVLQDADDLINLLVEHGASWVCFDVIAKVARNLLDVVAEAVAE